jgi:two-component system KDP operon response regulator KdpE
VNREANRVLVVDDDPSIRRAVKVALSKQGYEVAVATNGRSALELGARVVDVMVIDPALPDIDGYELIARIRSFSDIPIVVTSAHVSRTAELAALDAGADDYLAKPFSVEELAARIGELCPLARTSPTDC